eukprot:800387-Rhodomonas_salina.1
MSKIAKAQPTGHEKDEDLDIVSILKHHITLGLIDRYWDNIPLRGEILNYYISRDKKPTHKYALSIAYSISDMASKCIRHVVKKTMKDPYLTPDAFKEQFVTEFRTAFKRGFPFLKKRLIDDAAIGKLFDAHLHLYPKNTFDGFLKYERAAARGGHPLTEPFINFNNTLNYDYGLQVRKWLTRQNTRIGSLAAQFPSNLGSMCKACVESNAGV